MSTLTGGTRDSSYWHPAMTANTNTSSYWLNWRALLCGVWVAIAIVLALKPILKYEGFRKKVDEEEEEEEERVGSLYEDETWMTCLKGLHPAWLLSYRVFAFFVLLVTLVFTSIVDDANIYYFYTQWTFLLVTIYFGLGSLLSGHGCYKYYKRSSGDRVDNVEVDTEQANDVNIAPKGSNDELKCPETDDCCVRQRAGVWGYAFQIMFQMNAGAVLLTDCVFWCIIVPFLEINDYTLNALDINLHTINVVFLLGDTALNCLRFPCFLDSLLLSMDGSLRYISMDSPRFSQPMVALSISGLIVLVCSSMVFYSGCVAYPMLWWLCTGHKVETPFT